MSASLLYRLECSRSVTGSVWLINGTASFSGTAANSSINNLTNVSVNGNFARTMTGPVVASTGMLVGYNDSSQVATGTFSGTK